MKSTFIGLVAAVVVIGGGYLLVQNSRVDANAQEVIESTFQNSAASMNSYTIEGNMDMDVETEEGGGNMNFTYSGAMEKTVLSDGKLEIEGTLSMGADFDIDAAETVVAGNVVLDAVIKGEVFYLKVKLSDELLSQIPVPMFTDLNDTWIKISLEEIRSSGLLPPEALAQFDAQIDAQGGLYGNADLQEKMIRLVADSKILKALSIKNGPTLEGKETYVLAVTIDPTKLDDFTIAYMELVAPGTELTPPTDEQIAEMEAATTKFLKDLEAEIVVEKESRFLRGITIHMPINDEETNTKITVDGNFTYNNINEPVEITVPAESTSIMDILAPFLGAMMMAPAQ